MSKNIINWIIYELSKNKAFQKCNNTTVQGEMQIETKTRSKDIPEQRNKR